jgi:hypothetical protein
LHGGGSFWQSPSQTRFAAETSGELITPGKLQETACAGSRVGHLVNAPGDVVEIPIADQVGDDGIAVLVEV